MVITPELITEHIVLDIKIAFIVAIVTTLILKLGFKKRFQIVGIIKLIEAFFIIFAMALVIIFVISILIKHYF